MLMMANKNTQYDIPGMLQVVIRIVSLSKLENISNQNMYMYSKNLFNFNWSNIQLW